EEDEAEGKEGRGQTLHGAGSLFGFLAKAANGKIGGRVRRCFSDCRAGGKRDTIKPTGGAPWAPGRKFFSPRRSLSGSLSPHISPSAKGNGMRHRCAFSACAAAVLLLAGALWQIASTTADPPQVERPAADGNGPAKPAESPLPIRQVVLFNSGVGYFQHEG